MAKLPGKFSVSKPVKIVATGGHKVRPVDVDGIALDDSTHSYSVAHPVTVVDGTTGADSNGNVFSVAKPVTVDPTGTPVISVDGGGLSLGTALGTGVVLPPSVVYSTLIGLGVDSTGYADLTPDVGASIFYVRPSTGNDSNAGTNPSAPLATMAAAKAKVVSGRGDHILVAEGESLNETLPPLDGVNGLSAQYPMVIQSYNPADPTNQAYWGRGYQRNARPKLTATTGHSITPQGGTLATPNFIAIRGFDFDTPELTDLTISAFANGSPSAVAGSFWLIEGNLLKYHSISFSMVIGDQTYPRDDALQSDTVIIRNNSGRGNFSSTQSEGGSGLYLDGWKGSLVIEDNVFYHRGWSETVTRSQTDYTLGGPNKFKHSYYIQSTNDGTLIFRRNWTSDGSADGGQFRCSNSVTENIFVDNPLQDIGGGTRYDVYKPNGIDGEFAYNAVFGSSDFVTGDPGGGGIYVLNTTSLSAVYRNVFARSSNPSTALGTFVIGSDYQGTKTIVDVHSNIAYLWATNTNTFGGTDNYGQVTKTFENNYTDANAYTNNVGSNSNIGSLTPPNPYDATGFYAAVFAAHPEIGAGTKTALLEYMLAYPEAHIQRDARQILLTGYGVANSCGDLAMRSNFIVGVASTIEFYGGTPGSTFTGTLPTGFTLNSSLRSISYDGSGSAIDSNFTITETPLLGSPKTNTVSYRVLSQAATTLNPSDKSANITLSASNIIAKAPSALAAVRAVRALGSGKYHWEFAVETNADVRSPCVLDSSANLDATHYFALTADPDGAGYFDGSLRYNTTVQSISPILNIGDTWRFEYDGTAQLLWIGDSTGWKNGDPATGTGGLSLAGMGASRFVGFQGDSGDKAIFNFGENTFVYTPTAGFGNV